MAEKILYEKMIKEEQGFDGAQGPVTVGMPGYAGQNSIPDSMNQTGQGGNFNVQINTQGGTNTTDIAQQANNVKLAQNVISRSLPYMIGYVQPLDSSVGYIFGLQQKDKTNILPSDGSVHNNPAGDDIVILRKFIQTEIREVVLDLTNETAQDIHNLFGDSFPQNYDNFLQSGGELWDGPNGPLATFFLNIARQRMTQKINKDFTDWLSNVSTDKGSCTIQNWAGMDEIFGVISELREALYKNTIKNGMPWILVSPRIASYLSSVMGSSLANGSEIADRGRRFPNNQENGYVMTMGDIEVYQYNFYDDPKVTGGTSADSELEGKIYMGYRGSADSSSIYYTPYNEYIVQGGEDYSTGQSNVFYRVRDQWETNPLDTYDESLTHPELELNNPDPLDPKLKNKSQFVVHATITFQERILN